MLNPFDYAQDKLREASGLRKRGRHRTERGVRWPDPSLPLRACPEHGRRDDSRHMYDKRQSTRSRPGFYAHTPSRLAAGDKPSPRPSQALWASRGDSTHEIPMRVLLSKLIRSHIGFVCRRCLPTQGRQARPIGFVRHVRSDAVRPSLRMPLQTRYKPGAPRPLGLFGAMGAYPRRSWRPVSAFPSPGRVLA